MRIALLRSLGMRALLLSAIGTLSLLVCVWLLGRGAALAFPDVYVPAMPKTVLLLGVGGEGHDGGSLTDTIMLAALHPKSRAGVMLSIPRDLLLPESTVGRINAFVVTETQRLLQKENLSEAEAERRAIAAFAEQISDLLEVPIDGVLQVDFQTVVQTVDAVGGIDIDVPERIVDVHYPVAEGRTGTFVIEAGPQHIDGETALKYARSRYSTSDFDRALRQQQIIAALAERIKLLRGAELFSFAQKLLRTVMPHVRSTMPASQLAALAQEASNISMQRVRSYNMHVYVGGDTSEAQPGGFLYTPDPELYGGASVLAPVSYDANVPWQQLSLFARLVLLHPRLHDPVPAIVIRHSRAATLQGWRLRNELLRYGWTNVSLLREGEGFAPGVSASPQTDVQVQQCIAALAGLPAQELDAYTGTASLLISLDDSYRFQPFVSAERADDVQEFCLP